MPRMPIPRRRSFPPTAMRPPVTCGISTGFPVLSPCGGQVAYALLTSAPVAASVHPEPGSNSPLFHICSYLFLCYLQHGAPMPGIVSLTEGFRPLPFTSSFCLETLTVAILSMCSYSRPAKGRTAKIGNPPGTCNSATRFFSKKIAGGGVVPRGRAPFPFCVCKGTHIAPYTQERSGLFSERGDRPRRKMLCDTAL